MLASRAPDAFGGRRPCISSRVIDDSAEEEKLVHLGAGKPGQAFSREDMERWQGRTKGIFAAPEDAHRRRIDIGDKGAEAHRQTTIVIYLNFFPLFVLYRNVWIQLNRYRNQRRDREVVAPTGIIDPSADIHKSIRSLIDMVMFYEHHRSHTLRRAWRKNEQIIAKCWRRFRGRPHRIG